MNVIHENVLVELPEVKQTGVYMPEEEQTKEFVGTVLGEGDMMSAASKLNTCASHLIMARLKSPSVITPANLPLSEITGAIPKLLLVTPSRTL